MLCRRIISEFEQMIEFERGVSIKLKDAGSKNQLVDFCVKTIRRRVGQKLQISASEKQQSTEVYCKTIRQSDCNVTFPAPNSSLLAIHCVTLSHVPHITFHRHQRKQNLRRDDRYDAYLLHKFTVKSNIISGRWNCSDRGSIVFTD